MREARERVEERRPFELAFVKIEEIDQLTAGDADQSPGTLAAGGELGGYARPVRDSSAPAAQRRIASSAGDDLADRDTDDEHQHHGLDVLCPVDSQRVVRPSEEQVEGDRGFNTRGGPGRAAAQSCGPEDHEGENERDVSLGHHTTQRV